MSFTASITTSKASSAASLRGTNFRSTVQGEARWANCVRATPSADAGVLSGSRMSKQIERRGQGDGKAGRQGKQEAEPHRQAGTTQAGRAGFAGTIRNLSEPPPQGNQSLVAAVRAQRGHGTYQPVPDGGTTQEPQTHRTGAPRESLSGAADRVPAATATS